MKFAHAVRIGKRLVGPGHPTYVIAEVGSNFDGSLPRAKHLADLAKKAGADAFKMQNFTTPTIASEVGFGKLAAFQKKWKQPVIEIYRASELPHAWVKEIADHCKKIGIDFISSAYDEESVDVLEKARVPAHKLGAGELTNLEFIDYVAKTGKPLMMSVGAATMEEAERAVAVVRKAGNNTLILLQCVTSYPSPVEDANLLAMLSLRKKFGTVVGFSDHTIGKEGGADDPLGGLTVPLGAVALGGSVIEKHVTDNRSRKGTDHPFALTMEEFARMVKGIRAMERARGTGEKKIMPSEKTWRTTQRRGAYALRDVKKGEKLVRDAIIFLRPALGFAPPELRSMLGKKMKRSVRAGQPIKADHV